MVSWIEDKGLGVVYSHIGQKCTICVDGKLGIWV